MTDRQARKLIYAVIEANKNRFNDDTLEALEMGRTALEQKSCDDAEQIDYHDDFATALKKINDYEMTRDERVAISILNAYKEGYESAIEDYKQEPCDDAVSREAVMKIVDEEWICNADYDFRSLVKSIEQLPSVTPKPIECDDAISREAVLNRIDAKVQEYCHYLAKTYTDTSADYERKICIFAENIRDEIKDLPPVTQKSGKWNEYYTSQKGNNVFNCKECGHTFVVMQGKDNMKFCPNCGAKMVEPQESDEKKRDTDDSTEKH